MHNTQSDSHGPTRSVDERASVPNSESTHRPPLMRTAVAGVLMGLANLVPGVSGGTMVVVMGLYDEFIGSLARVTRLRFTRSSLLFLGTLVAAALVAIVTLAGTLSQAVTLHRAAMFSLFIGMTLGGAPLLAKMLGRVTRSAVVGVAVGIALMCVLGLSRSDPPDRDALRAAAAAGEIPLHADYARDLAAGALGMSAMVLPGVSGAYMLLILGRYETILAAVATAKDFALTQGGGSDPSASDPLAFLHVLIPTALGAIVGLVLLSNLLKWLLEAHRTLTVGMLLGVLLGSVVGIWPFGPASTAMDYTIGAVLAVAGFCATYALARIAA